MATLRCACRHRFFRRTDQCIFIKDYFSILPRELTGKRRVQSKLCRWTSNLHRDTAMKAPCFCVRSTCVLTINVESIHANPTPAPHKTSFMPQHVQLSAYRTVLTTLHRYNALVLEAIAESGFEARHLRCTDEVHTTHKMNSGDMCTQSTCFSDAP